MVLSVLLMARIQVGYLIPGLRQCLLLAVCERACACVCVCTCVRLCMCVCVYVHVCMCVVCVCECECETPLVWR